MQLLTDLIGVAVATLLGMVIMWPMLKRGASSKEELAERWKTLWRAGLICWVGGVVTAHYVGQLREEVKAIDLKAEQASRGPGIASTTQRQR